MRPSSAQFLKEARQMAWPWAAVTFPGLALLASIWLKLWPQTPTGGWHGFADWVLAAGAFAGSLLLAALPLGTEFQYRTLAMRLAQPIDRRTFWQQKFLVTIAAIVPPAAIYCVVIALRYGRASAITAAAWITLVLAGGIPFTLLTRSTIGSVVLNNSGSFAVTFAWTYYEEHGRLPDWFWAIAILLAAYAAVMVWLGRRMLLRFQATDGMQAGEALVPGARLLPRFMADWFRCQPTQALRNLVRREFRLVRVLWPLSLLYVAAWVLLVAFRQLPSDRPDSRLVAFAFTAILGVLIAVLAGTLSLGEEKTWGTHEWHMTLPISRSLQWLVKLLFALTTSLVCTALAPMFVLILGGWLGRSSGHFLNGSIAAGWMLEAVGVTFVAFWCACVVRGTVQATIWVFPLCLAMGFAGSAGPWLLGLVANPFQRLLAAVFSRLDAIVVHRAAWQMFSAVGVNNALALLLAPLLAVALVQSHRLFRAQVAANRLRVVRCAVPLLTVAFVCGLTDQVFWYVLTESSRQQSTLLRETDSAIAAVQSANPHPRRLTLNDLARVSRLSDGTQRWLRNASVTVAPAPDRPGNGPGPYFPGRLLIVVPSAQLKDRVPYSAVVRAANGSECSLLFQVQKQGPVGFLTAICQ